MKNLIKKFKMLPVANKIMLLTEWISFLIWLLFIHKPIDSIVGIGFGLSMINSVYWHFEGRVFKYPTRFKKERKLYEK